MKRLVNVGISDVHEYFCKVFVCFIFVVVFSCSSSDDFDSELSVQRFPERNLDFSLWQLDAFFEEVQMGYILRADDGKIIVIDGGGKLTAPILKQYLQQLGAKVDTWIITHPHADHIDAFLEIIQENDIEVDQILHVPLADAWVQKNEPSNAEKVIQYNQTIAGLTTKVKAMKLGDVLTLAAGLQMQVFNGYNDDIVINAINNSSLTFKISSKSKSMLFLGDLGEEAGVKLLKNLSDTSALQADYVQMAHHGQEGVNRDFYVAVNATYALWPTPKWLWNNQLQGESVNSGTFKTIIVREWMDELGVKKNYVSGLEGNLQID